MGRGSSNAGKKTPFTTFDTDSDAYKYFMSPEGGFTKWKDGMTGGEKKSVEGYTGIDYKQINARLREGDDLGSYKKQVDEIDSAISKFNLKKNIKVYRGTGMHVAQMMFGTTNPKEIEAKFKGGTIKDKGYMSSSTNKNKTFNGGFRLHITVKKGKGKGAYIAPISNFEGESEFLIKRGANLKITGARNKGSDLIVYAEM